jgi:hypothetical protein
VAVEKVPLGHALHVLPFAYVPAPQFSPASASVAASTAGAASGTLPSGAPPSLTVASAPPASRAPASASVTTIVAVGGVPASGDPTLENAPHGGWFRAFVGLPDTTASLALAVVHTRPGTLKRPFVTFQPLAPPSSSATKHPPPPLV